MDNKLYMYVGCWGKGAAGGGEGEGVTILSFDQETGAMEKLGVYKDTEEPGVLEVSADSKYLYVTNELFTHGGKLHAGGCMSSFAIQPDGSLKELNMVPSVGSGPVYCCIDPKGKYVLVTNHGTLDGVTRFVKGTDGGFEAEVLWDDSTLAMLPIKSDGSLGEAVDIYTFEGEGSFQKYMDDISKVDYGYPGKGQAPYFLLQFSPHAHSVRFFDNGFGVVCERGTDTVYLFEIDYDKEKIVMLDSHQSRLGIGPRHVATHPTLPYFYATNELENSVTAFKVDFAAKKFEEIQNIATLEDGSESVNAPSDIVVSADGRFVYSGNRGDNSIAVFKVNEGTGELTRVQVKQLSGPEPRGVVLSPNGRFLVTGHKVDNKVESLAIDPDTGCLTETGHVVEVLTPTCMRFAQL